VKITKLGRPLPLISGASLFDGDSTPGSPFTPGPPGHVPTSNGSNSYAWASNVALITANGSNLVQGPFVNFQSGTGTTFSVSSNTLTINSSASGGDVFDALGWFNVEDYGAVHDGTTDDTSAIQDAIDACIAAGGGTVYFPSDGSGYTTYAIEGALQDTSTYNSQLKIPTAASWTYIRFLGAKGASVQLVSDWNGAITDNPAILAAGKHKAVIGDPTYNPVWVTFEDIRIVAPDNPKLSAVCMCAAVTARAEGFVNIAVSAYPATLPTNSNAVGVCFPWGLNDGHSGGFWVIEGYYTGARPSEQFDGQFWIVFTRNPLWFEGQTGSPALLRHACHISRLEAWYFTHGIRFSGDERWVNIGIADFELDDPGYTTTYTIDDASNLGRGFINWHTTDYSTGPTDGMLINGGGGLSFFGAYAKRWTLNNVVGIPTGTNPATNPTSGRRIYADSGDGHLSARTPAGDIIDYETDISGVTISGTPAIGDVLTATSTTAANWQTPSASSGGPPSILLESGSSVPFTFDEILQESDGSDFLWASE
jgi:hypothetical protein